MPETFASILYPLSAIDFKNNYYARQGVYISGQADKFKKMFDWQALNNILETSFMATGDALLSTLDTDKFFNLSERYEFIETCNNGATIQLINLEKYSFVLNKVADALANELQASHIRVNLFASYPGKAVYSTHYDGYDGLILQLEGEKRWQLFEPSRREQKNVEKQEIQVKEFIAPKWGKTTYNGASDEVRGYEGDDSPGGTPPYIDQVLKPGDFLYVPSGHWHKVTPGEIASLHLTIGITYNRGMDFFSWFKEKLQKDSYFHQFFPLLTKEEIKTEISNPLILNSFLNHIKQRVDIHLNKELFTEFKESLLLNSNPAEIFNFPVHYKPDTISDADDKFFKKSISRYQIRPEENENIKITINGQSIILNKSLEPFIRFIFSAKSFTIRDLFTHLSYDSFQQVFVVLNNLVRNNIIKITEA